MDHIREYGTLKAMGAPNRYVYKVIMKQAAFQCGDRLCRGDDRQRARSAGQPEGRCSYLDAAADGHRNVLSDSGDVCWGGTGLDQ
jgi:hypothetical protein